ncbi:MAG TPA: hypothetical protein VF498_10290 [Anaerolineales bacterium]
MNEKPFLVLNMGGDEAIAGVYHLLSHAGLQVVQTFDFQAARLSHPQCTCPHHGTEKCDCQMVILLIYGNGHDPVSLMAHSHDGQTLFAVVDTPEQRPDPHTYGLIRRILAPLNFASYSDGWAYAAGG